MPWPWARLALIVLLVASLGLKVRSLDVADQPGDQPNGAALLGALAADGFAVADGAGLQGPAWIADKGDCHIEIVAVSPLGWHQSAMTVRAGNQGLAYVYAGKVYAEQPIMLTKLGYYWHKLANYFYPSGQPPVFGVVTSSGCATGPVGIAQMARLLP